MRRLEAGEDLAWYPGIATGLLLEDSVETLWKQWVGKEGMVVHGNWPSFGDVYGVGRVATGW